MDSRTRKIRTCVSKGNMDYEKRVDGTYTDINIVITHINDTPLGELSLTINARSESCESTLDYVVWPHHKHEDLHFIEPSLEARIIISREKKHPVATHQLCVATKYNAEGYYVGETMKLADPRGKLWTVELRIQQETLKATAHCPDNEDDFDGDCAQVNVVITHIDGALLEGNGRTMSLESLSPDYAVEWIFWKYPAPIQAPSLNVRITLTCQ